ncbi:MAG: TRAP transporter small permease subunit [Desulfovermiculus sp.]
MKSFGRLVSLLILPLIAGIVYSSLKAFFFGRTPIWTFEISLFLFGCFFMLGAGYTHREKKHVAVDVVNYYVSPKWQRILGIFSELVVLFVALVLIYISVPAAIRSFHMQERSTHQTPFNPYVWWYRWVIPISCALISWQAFKDMLSLILSRPDRSASAENE